MQVTGPRRAFVHTAELVLAWDTPAEGPGGAVTLALCGSVAHQPPCRWPHHSAIGPVSRPARFRTVFIATDDEEPAVRDRIDAALRAGAWGVRASGAGVLHVDERDLAERLASSAAP